MFEILPHSFQSCKTNMSTKIPKCNSIWEISSFGTNAVLLWACNGFSWVNALMSTQECAHCKLIAWNLQPLVNCSTEVQYCDYVSFRWIVQPGNTEVQELLQKTTATCAYISLVLCDVGNFNSKSTRKCNNFLKLASIREWALKNKNTYWRIDLEENQDAHSHTVLRLVCFAFTPQTIHTTAHFEDPLFRPFWPSSLVRT